MDRVFRVSVCTKLALYIFIAEQSHLTRKVFSMRTEDASVEGDWGEERKRRGFEPSCRVRGCGVGEEAVRKSHFRDLEEREKRVWGDERRTDSDCIISGTKVVSRSG